MNWKMVNWKYKQLFYYRQMNTRMKIQGQRELVTFFKVYINYYELLINLYNLEMFV